MAYWAILFTIIGGIFRRWLGGGYKDTIGKVSRFWKLLVLVAILILMYVITGRFPHNWKEWFCMVWTIGWVIRFSSHTHGDYYVVDETKPDEERSWWVGKVLKLIFGKGGYYNFEGNFVGLTLGYLVPATLASITMTNHWFWLAGFTTSIGYTVCELILKFTGRRTELAEYFNGAMMFFLFFINLI